MVKKIQTRKEYQALVRTLIEHDKLYYEKCDPQISDYEYDQLFQELKQAEQNHPEWIEKKSPTQRVEEGVTRGFQQKEHKTAMLSLANTYSQKELSDWIVRVERRLEGKRISFCCELKIDGIAVSLFYRKGQLIHALTRGNGRKGDDITQNIQTITSIPLILQGKDFPDSMEIRGEVFLTLKMFKELNRRREEESLEPFVNPRNAAAGSLKLLDAKEVATRKLSFTSYGIAGNDSPKVTQFETLHFLKKKGFPVSLEKHICQANDLSEIMRFSEHVLKERKNLPFEIDGVVVKVNDLHMQSELGITGKTPRYAVAYKFAAESAETRVERITVQVGRSGVLTPVAELEPVFLAGSKISRATLHNADEVARKDIRVGDWVLIEKGGDVIPKVVSVDLARRSKKSVPWNMPSHCPVCHAKVVHRTGEVAVRCPNSHCLGQRIRRLFYFASKQAMDIDHFGEKVIEQLVDLGLVTRVSDLYTLDASALSQLEGFKKKSIDNLLKSIERSKKCTLSRFIMGLGIKFVGVETAELLAKEAGDLQHLLKMTEDDFRAIEGIGEKTAREITDFFLQKEHLEEIERLLQHGVQPESLEKQQQMGHEFSGKSFVLTGTLDHYTRDQAASLIKERGGKVSGSVSRQTDFLLLGEEPGSKYEKAKKLEVCILSEKQFEKML